MSRVNRDSPSYFENTYDYSNIVCRSRSDGLSRFTIDSDVRSQYQFTISEQRLSCSRLFSALKCKKNYILSSPTGTGKTSMLQSTILEYQRQMLESNIEDAISSNIEPIRIFYITRTHSQVEQVVQELRKSPYAPTVIALGSRALYCPATPQDLSLENYGDTFPSELIRARMCKNSTQIVDGVYKHLVNDYANNSKHQIEVNQGNLNKMKDSTNFMVSQTFAHNRTQIARLNNDGTIIETDIQRNPHSTNITKKGEPDKKMARGCPFYASLFHPHAHPIMKAIVLNTKAEHPSVSLSTPLSPLPPFSPLNSDMSFNSKNEVKSDSISQSIHRKRMKLDIKIEDGSKICFNNGDTEKKENHMGITSELSIDPPIPSVSSSFPPFVVSSNNDDFFFSEMNSTEKTERVIITSSILPPNTNGKSYKRKSPFDLAISSVVSSPIKTEQTTIKDFVVINNKNEKTALKNDHQNQSEENTLFTTSNGWRNSKRSSILKTALQMNSKPSTGTSLMNDNISIFNAYLTHEKSAQDWNILGVSGFRAVCLAMRHFGALLKEPSLIPTILSMFKNKVLLQHTLENKSEVIAKVNRSQQFHTKRMYIHASKSNHFTSKGLHNDAIASHTQMESLASSKHEDGQLIGSVCPYFLSQQLAHKVQIIVAPYNYVLNPSIRESSKLPLQNSILVIDEGHNLDSVLRDSGSFELNMSQLDALIFALYKLFPLDDQNSINFFSITCTSVEEQSGTGLELHNNTTTKKKELTAVLRLPNNLQMPVIFQPLQARNICLEWLLRFKGQFKRTAEQSLKVLHSIVIENYNRSKMFSNRIRQNDTIGKALDEALKRSSSNGYRFELQHNDFQPSLQSKSFNANSDSCDPYFLTKAKELVKNEEVRRSKSIQKEQNRDEPHVNKALEPQPFVKIELDIDGNIFGVSDFIDDNSSIKNEPSKEHKEGIQDHHISIENSLPPIALHGTFLDQFLPQITPPALFHQLGITSQNFDLLGDFEGVFAILLHPASPISLLPTNKGIVDSMRNAILSNNRNINYGCSNMFKLEYPPGIGELLDMTGKKIDKDMATFHEAPSSFISLPPPGNASIFVHLLNQLRSLYADELLTATDAFGVSFNPVLKYPHTYTCIPSVKFPSSTEFVQAFASLLPTEMIDEENMTLSEVEMRVKQSLIESFGIKFSLMRPDILLDPVVTLSRSIVLASGTLAPLRTFVMELGQKFTHKLFNYKQSSDTFGILEGKHIISVEQFKLMRVGFVTDGKGQLEELTSMQSHRDAKIMHIRFANAAIRLLKNINLAKGSGVLMLFTSKKQLENFLDSLVTSFEGKKASLSLVQFFREIGLIVYDKSDVTNDFINERYQREISRWKTEQKFCQSKSSNIQNIDLIGFNRSGNIPEFNGSGGDDEISNTTAAAINAHKFNIDNKQTSVVLGVFRGKLSEGVSFNDDYCRLVISFGLPYLNFGSTEVLYKRKYNDLRYKAALQHEIISSELQSTLGISSLLPHKSLGGSDLKSTHLASGDQWYVDSAYRAINQGLGRVIRSLKDYGAVVLMERRINFDMLSKWTEPHQIRNIDNLDDALNELREGWAQMKTAAEENFKLKEKQGEEFKLKTKGMEGRKL